MRQIYQQERTQRIAFSDLRFAPLDAHRDGGRGDDAAVDLLLPVYLPLGARGNGYEAGMLEIRRKGEPCFVPLHAYPVRKLYRELIGAAIVTVALCSCGLMLGIAFFFVANEGSVFAGEAAAHRYIWEFEPNPTFFHLLVAALVFLGVFLIARSIHRSALVQEPVVVPEPLMTPLRAALDAIHLLRRKDIPAEERESRPGTLGARAAGPGGELLGLVIGGAYDLREGQQREARAIMMRRALAEVLLGEVERFGAARVIVSSDQFRKSDL